MKIPSKLQYFSLLLLQDDSGGSIGRRYSRTDEIGIPYGLTVDFQSVDQQPCTVTLRHSLSMKQVRMQVDEVGPVLEKLVAGKMPWEEVMKKYPLHEPPKEKN